MERVGGPDLAVGERLRQVRRHKGWSLADVEIETGGEFKASAVGAYERGDRAISAVRLARLADVYGIPPGALLEGVPSVDLVVDLAALESADAAESEVIDRFLSAVRIMRRDPSAALPGIRRSDLRLLSALLAAGEPTEDD